MVVKEHIHRHHHRPILQIRAAAVDKEYYLKPIPLYSQFCRDKTCWDGLLFTDD